MLDRHYWDECFTVCVREWRRRLFHLNHPTPSQNHEKRIVGFQYSIGYRDCESGGRTGLQRQTILYMRRGDAANTGPIYALIQRLEVCATGRCEKEGHFSLNPPEP